MFIVKKKIGNEEYYYLRKSERDGDKVRAISVAYLGKGKKEAEKKAEEIIRKVGKDIKGKDERKENMKEKTNNEKVEKGIVPAHPPQEIPTKNKDKEGKKGKEGIIEESLMRSVEEILDESDFDLIKAVKEKKEKPGACFKIVVWNRSFQLKIC